jgi:DNA-binding IclR family transcriptional regulator
MACPIHDAQGLILGAISLVATFDRMQMIQVDKLATLLMNTAQEINENLN